MQLYCNDMASRTYTAIQTEIEIASTETAKYPEKPSVRKAAQAIIDYFFEHPRARDTMRGIAEWWIHDTLVATKEAIEFLIDRGLVEKAQRNGQILFSRNPFIGQRTLKSIRTALSSKS